MTDRYEVVWSPPARRALVRLPEKVATAVVELAYNSLAVNPWRLGKPLQFEFAGLHSARRGDYRMIYRIDDEKGRVFIVAVEHRSDAYRSR